VRGYRFRGLFSDHPVEGVLGPQRIGRCGGRQGVRPAEPHRHRLLRIARHAEGAITDLMEFCERNTIRFRVIPSGDSFIPVVQATGTWSSTAPCR
jgi:hypothetical protein